MKDADPHCKDLRTVPNAAAYVEHYRRLEESDLGPRVVSVTDRQICLEKLATLREWVDARIVEGHLPDVPRRVMGRRLIALLEKVHDLGFCHRDIHIRNFVVRDGAPLLVDPKFATDNEGRPCYDLAGPEPSRTQIPQQHVDQRANTNRYGVWWANADPVSGALVSTFGPVSELC